MISRTANCRQRLRQDVRCSSLWQGEESMALWVPDEAPQIDAPFCCFGDVKIWHVGFNG